MTSPRPSRPALPDYETALSAALSALAPRLEVERVPLSEAPGRVLAESISADRDYPPFNRATMDGYAVRASDVAQGTGLRVVGMVAAGSAERPSLAPGETVRIATGAPLPPDANAVIPHELSDRSDPVRFTVESMEARSNVHFRGADAAAGQALLAPGIRLGAQHLGILATVGVTNVPVFRRARVAVLTSGDEVLPPDAPNVLDYQIRNSGAPMLSMMIPAMGGQVGEVAHVPDEPPLTLAAVREALARHDVLITIGGISAGERDCFHVAFEACGVEAVVRGASIQPGKPIFVGRTGVEGRPVVVIALPGNPVSVLATAHLFAWPIVRALAGLPAALPWTCVELARPVQPNGRRQAFRPSIWHRASDEAEVLDWAGSGDLIHTARADGLLALPVQQNLVPDGTALPFLSWCWIG